MATIPIAAAPLTVPVIHAVAASFAVSKRLTKIPAARSSDTAPAHSSQEPGAKDSTAR